MKLISGTNLKSWIWLVGSWHDHILNQSEGSSFRLVFTFISIKSSGTNLKSLKYFNMIGWFLTCLYNQPIRKQHSVIGLKFVWITLHPSIICFVFLITLSFYTVLWNPEIDYYYHHLITLLTVLILLHTWHYLDSFMQIIPRKSLSRKVV